MVTERIASDDVDDASQSRLVSILGRADTERIAVDAVDNASQSKVVGMLRKAEERNAVDVVDVPSQSTPAGLVLDEQCLPLMLDSKSSKLFTVFFLGELP